MAGIKNLFIKKNNSSFIQLIRYSMVGGTATVLDMFLFFILADVLNINHIMSNILSFSSGLMVNFYLSRAWVFESSLDNFGKDFIIFALIGIAGLGLSSFILYFFIDLGFMYIIFTFMDKNKILLISKSFTVFIVFFWNFFARKTWVFRQTG